MKKETIVRFLAIVSIALGLVACSGNAAATPASVPAADAIQACLSQTSSATVADAEALIQAKLENHHDDARIFDARHTREEWNATLDRMIGYGARISDAEKQLLIDYLLCRQQ